MGKLIEKLFGNYSTKELKRIKPTMEKVLGYEDEFRKLSDQELRGKTDEFKQRLAKGETWTACCRKLSLRCVKRREGLSHRCTIRPDSRRNYSASGPDCRNENGEGKTLVSTLPAYLNALTGKGVHIVTVNDYLAKSQSEWMGKIYEFLGLRVGLIIHGLTNEERRKAYCGRYYLWNK